MSRWRLETAPAFDRSVRRSDESVRRRVRAFLDDLCLLEDPRVRGKLLHGELSGFRRYRIGDYRVIASIEDSRLVIVAITLAHRSEVYRKR